MNSHKKNNRQMKLRFIKRQDEDKKDDKKDDKKVDKKEDEKNMTLA